VREGQAERQPGEQHPDGAAGIAIASTLHGVSS
jgi:hypothetical protein